jgi:hypothetical protein
VSVARNQICEPHRSGQQELELCSLNRQRRLLGMDKKLAEEDDCSPVRNWRTEVSALLKDH